ncbi:hypothetical protein BDD12DRAFT_12721 [Trichophaea hybrida]|nr:hypothetical protein BDD12DRAFT_12721 [Trichophaea hybrida]
MMQCCRTTTKRIMQLTFFSSLWREGFFLFFLGRLTIICLLFYTLFSFLFTRANWVVTNCFCMGGIIDLVGSEGEIRMGCYCTECIWAGGEFLGGFGSVDCVSIPLSNIFPRKSLSHQSFSVFYHETRNKKGKKGDRAMDVCWAERYRFPSF